MLKARAVAIVVITVIVVTFDEKFVIIVVTNANIITMTRGDIPSTIGVKFVVINSVSPTFSFDTALPRRTPIEIK